MKIGPFSRGGHARGLESLTAADHDMGYDALLVPFGILEIGRGEQSLDQLWIGFGQSRETSDFIADSLERWWQQRCQIHNGIKHLQINLDNGPEISSSRTQFMNRLVQFSDRSGLDIELVYYPPYHSKYNPIERCWGILESHWNGAILSSVEVALRWAALGSVGQRWAALGSDDDVAWRGVPPLIEVIDGVYDRGVTIARKAFLPILDRLDKSNTLKKWSVKISAQPVGY